MSHSFYRNLNSIILIRQLCTASSSLYKLKYNLVPKDHIGISGPFVYKQEFHTSKVLLKVIPYKLSDIGEGIFEVTIKEWFVQSGEKVKQFQEICEVQSDKAAVTITCRYDGVIQKLYHQQDDVCKVGTPLVDIEVADDVGGGEEKVEQTVSGGEDESSAVPGSDGGIKVLATPPVRKLAKDLGIKLSEVVGTGRDGRILREDVHNFAKPQEKYIPTGEPSPIIVSQDDKPVKLTPIQKVMIQTMTLSGRVPQFGYCEEVKAANLREFKKRLQERYGKEGISFTYMPIILKATSIALTHFPILNSVFDETQGTMVYKPYHNIGLAMDTQQGLVVPNVKNVERKSIVELAVELMELHKLGVNGKIEPHQLTGGTFSISNIGAIGGTYARPMILPPEVCIVAIGRIYQPGGVGDYIMNTSYSADHRVIDGATVSRFSNLWKELIEEPDLISAELK